MGRTLILHPAPKGADPAAEAGRLAEGESLTHALDLNLAGGDIVWLTRPHPATLFGPGKVQEIAQRLPDEDVDLVIVNGALSPVQQRNLEKAWNAKVEKYNQMGKKYVSDCTDKESESTQEPKK